MSARRKWLIVLPALLGVALAAVLLFDLKYLTVSVALPAVVGMLGIGASVVWMLLARARQQRSRVADLAYQQAHGEARDEHHRFLARLDHELKNPVTAVRAAIAALRVGARSEQERATLLASIDAQAARLATLVADLRKLAELETREIEQVPVDMTVVLNDVVTDLTEQSAQSGAPVRTIGLTIPTVPWPLPTVLGDQDLLYLAVYNLLSNAAKFSAAQSPLEVRARDEEGMVIIEVADTGVGIPDDEQALVFDELARGAAARGIPGSGIGLSLVRIIATRHRGEVKLRSRQGQGTSAELRLPAVPAGSST
ncbi:MAG: sensor histidine kinase [Beutenbergiaceae bacterium]